MIKNRWNESEIDFLIKNYQLKGSRYISEKLNRTINGVKHKAKELGLINYNTKPWTDDEIEFIKQNYSKNGNKFVCEKLDRSRGSVSKKAKELNLVVEYKPTFTKEELQSAVNESYCISNLVSNLGKTNTGTYQRIIKKYLILYDIDTSHFDPYKKNKERILRGEVQKKHPIEYYLQYGSKIGSSYLKEKLYKYGLKKRSCEKCGQGEDWRGEKISMILDHINGDSKDNRIENLRILCPNCNAALPTHCRGYKKVKKQKVKEVKKEVKKEIIKLEKIKNNGLTIKKRENCLSQRRVDRPPLEQLKQEIKELGYSGTGRKYGVSDNAIRKWIKTYKERGF